MMVLSESPCDLPKWSFITLYTLVLSDAPVQCPADHTDVCDSSYSLTEQVAALYVASEQSYCFTCGSGETTDVTWRIAHSQVSLSDGAVVSDGTLVIFATECTFNTQTSVQITCDPSGPESSKTLLVFLAIFKPPRLPDSYTANTSQSLTLECDTLESTQIFIDDVYWIDPRGRITDAKNLYIPSVNSSDAGEYTCVIRSEDGAVLNASTTVIVLSTGTLPSITEQPRNTYVSDSRTDTLKFDCVADGDPTPDITWYREGIALETNVLENGTLSVQLTPEQVGEWASRKGTTYYCTATNKLGTVRSHDVMAFIALVVQNSPTVTPSVTRFNTTDDDLPSPTVTPSVTRFTTDDGNLAISTVTPSTTRFNTTNGDLPSPKSNSGIHLGYLGALVLLIIAVLVIVIMPIAVYCWKRQKENAVETFSEELSLSIMPSELSIVDEETKDQVDAVVETFKITKAGMEKIAAKLTECFKKGLEGDREVLKMLPTYVQSLPTNEEGDFLALNFGESTLRVILVTIKGHEITTKKEEKYEMESSLKDSTQEKLFDFIAECLSNFVKLYKITRTLPLGFTVCFPVQQTSLTSGTLLHWTKGFNVSEAEGKDIVKLLKDVEIDVVALVNDTTGTQMSVGLHDPNCNVGLILDAGFNACYMEKLDAIKKLSDNHPNPNYSTMIINCELGAFGDREELKPWLTEFDTKLNNRSLPQDQQTYEKMVSYKYLGEIARLAMQKLIQEKLLFEGKSSDKFDESDTFKTDYVITIEQEDRTACKKIFKDEFDIDATNADCKVVKRVCDAVTERAARLAGAGVVALVRKINKTDCCTVAVSGSLYKQHPNFPAKMQKAMDELHPNNKIVMKVSEDGSGQGAAVVAAVATRLKAGVHPSIIHNPCDFTVSAVKQSALFTCTLRGEPFPSIEWMHNDAPVSGSETIIISRDNDRSILTLMEVVENDKGEYYCKASNSVGEAKSNTASLHIEFGTPNVPPPDHEWKPVATLGDEPTLPILTAFKIKKGQVYNILEMTGAKYSDLGIHLLIDKDGSIVEQLERKCQLNCPRINREILMKWLRGEGERPTTWETLIKVLKRIKLVNLAEDIEESL